MEVSSSSSSGAASRNCDQKKNTPKYQTKCIDAREADKYAGDVPLAFLNWYRGNLVSARKAYGRTLQWRKENNVDNLLEQPQDHFQKILQHYPHAIHGRSRDGCVVLYEMLGRAQPKELLNVDGLTFEGLLWHFALRNEYVFQNLCSHEESLRWMLPQNDYERDKASNIPAGKEGRGKIMTVIDVKGIRVSDITADVIKFISKSSEIIDSHYPFRVQRLIICNAPRWFSSVWNLLARILPDSVKKKISIIPGVDELDLVIDPSQRPAEYGGTDVPLGQAPEMLAFLELENLWRSPTRRRSVYELSNPEGLDVTLGSMGNDNGIAFSHEIKRKKRPRSRRSGDLRRSESSQDDLLVRIKMCDNLPLKGRRIGRESGHTDTMHRIVPTEKENTRNIWSMFFVSFITCVARFLISGKVI
jgi:hypothetical protein